ncbi:MAG: helix-turn-helix domain-containing protein, partial [Desulfobacterales bacterium]
ALVICREEFIEPGHLPDYLLNRRTVSARGRRSDAPNDAAAEDSEPAHLLAVLRKNAWNRTKAAAELRIDRTTLWRKIKKFDLRPT